MSKPGQPSRSETDKLVFHGKKSLFAGWKYKVKAHLVALSDALVVTELQAKRRAPVARYEDALTREPIITSPGLGATDEEKDAHELQRAIIRQQSSYIKDLLNLTLPAGFTDERLMRRPVHEIWRAIEKRYELNTASRVVELVQSFKKIDASDFKSVSHLFQQLKAAREQANRNSAEALQIGLISKQLMLVKALTVLPGHLWGSAVDFTPDESTMDKVETKVCAIFGNKSKAEISALGKGASVNHVDAKYAKPAKTSALGKRKAGSQPDMHHNLGDMSCYYCAGTHNDISNGPHLKHQCAKRKRDNELKVFRRNIWSYPRAVKRTRVDQEPTPKMTG